MAYTTRSRAAVYACVGTVALTTAPARILASPQEQEHEQKGAGLGPGCAPDRPASAHHAGGLSVETPRGNVAPIPCLTNTGWRTRETSIAVTNRGTVLVQPAFPPVLPTGSPVGLIRSSDKGLTWEFVDPHVTPARIAPIDVNSWSDRDTGRIFWTSDLVGLNAFGIASRDGTDVYVDHSDDDGRTWVRSSSLPGMTYDHTQIFTGPPPSKLRNRMRTYPNIVYVAVSGGFTCTVFNFCGTHIARSFDGGMTFGESVAIPYPAECPAPGAFPSGGYGLNGVVARDGIVYLPFTPCERPYVAVSRDGGSTWNLSLVAETETTGYGELGLGIDKQGNLYAAWTALSDRLLYLAISRDGARHWDQPLMIAAPGVNETSVPQLVAGKRGQVAVAYYGSKNSPGRPFPPPCSGVASVECAGYENEIWDAYVTEAFDALAKKPLFWSATLNDPADPVWYGYTPTAMRVHSASGVVFAGNLGAYRPPNRSGHLDYFGMTMAPDNTPWAAFSQECPFGQPRGNRNCSQATGGQLDGQFILVGRLVGAHGKEDENNDD